ncbi:MAG TPA: hypothetical protein V6D17_19190, partial [Candidatus Obscuribacterales bacterium]
MSLIGKELGELLLDNDVLTPEELEQVQNEKLKTGEPLRIILERLNLASESQLKNTLELQYGCNYISLYKTDPDLEIVDLLPAKLIRQHRVVPVAREGARISLAMVNPDDSSAMGAVKGHLQCDIKRVVCMEDDFEIFLDAIRDKRLEQVKEQFAVADSQPVPTADQGNGNGVGDLVEASGVEPSAATSHQANEAAQQSPSPVPGKDVESTAAPAQEAKSSEQAEAPEETTGAGKGKSGLAKSTLGSMAHAPPANVRSFFKSSKPKPVPQEKTEPEPDSKKGDPLAPSWLSQLSKFAEPSAQESTTPPAMPEAAGTAGGAPSGGPEAAGSPVLAPLPTEAGPLKEETPLPPPEVAEAQAGAAAQEAGAETAAGTPGAGVQAATLESAALDEPPAEAEISLSKPLMAPEIEAAAPEPEAAAPEIEAAAPEPVASEAEVSAPAQVAAPDSIAETDAATASGAALEAAESEPAEPTAQEELLIEVGVLSREQIAEVRAEKRRSGDPMSVVLERLGIAGESELADAFDMQFGVDYIALPTIEIDKETLALLPEKVITQRRAIPVRKTLNKVVVAMVNPDDLIAVNDITFRLKGTEVRKAVCLEDDLEHYMRTTYRQTMGGAAGASARAAGEISVGQGAGPTEAISIPQAATPESSRPTEEISAPDTAAMESLQPAGQSPPSSQMVEPVSLPPQAPPQSP